MWSCTVHDGVAPESETAALLSMGSLIPDQSGLNWTHSGMDCMHLILLKGMGPANAGELMCTQVLGAELLGSRNSNPKNHAWTSRDLKIAG